MDEFNLAVPAVIREEDIAATGVTMGKANSMALTIAGISHAPRSLKYVTFAGRIDLDDMLYHGEHRFLTGEWESIEVDDLTLLPGLAKAPPAKPQAAKTDGVPADVV